MLLDPLEALLILIPVGVVSIVIFFNWLYPKLQHLGYWRFIEAWMAFFVAGGVIGLVIGSVTISVGPVTALENFIVAMIVALGMAPVVFRMAAQMNARRGFSPKSG